MLAEALPLQQLPIRSPSRAIVRLLRGAVKRSRSLLRREADVHPRWAERAAVCARCPLNVIDRCGKQYCGKPLLRQIDRDEATQGCGCPIGLKARDPAEHCPRTARFAASSKASPEACDCLWCVAGRDGR